MKFARWTFAIAGIYGLLVLPPAYFAADAVGRDYPPAVTHREYYYSFLSLALVWQFVFLLIARDPLRYRPLMLIAILEKLAFAVPCAVMLAQNNLPTPTAFVAGIDLTLGVAFLIAYVRTPKLSRDR